jgi:hypothetical protein
MIGLKDVSIFFNAKIDNSGILSEIGDLGLAPLRYLCGGKTMRVITQEQVVTIHSIASFHKDGEHHYSETTYALTSSPTHMLKALGSVLLIVPGLFLALVKLVDYAVDAEVRKNHRLVREHLIPINREIGTFLLPIKTEDELKEALTREGKNYLNRPTNALIIHGDGNLQINDEPGILQFNPMRLVLEGALIISQSSYKSRLDEDLLSTRKWESTHGWKMFTQVGTILTKVNTIVEALEAPLRRRGWLTWKCFHRVFVVPRQVRA